MKTILLTILGFIFLVLGAIGMILPVLPTTPFVLIAAGCFSGTPRLRAQVMRVGIFREYAQSYQSKCGLSAKTVRCSLLFLWSMMLISILLTRNLWIALLLLAIGLAVTIHILWMSRTRSVGEVNE